MEIKNANIFNDLTEYQRKLRKKGIGGSDAAAVLDRSKAYKQKDGTIIKKTPFDVYQEKLGYADDFNGNLSSALGSYLEDFVRRLYANTTGLDIEKPDALDMFHSKYPWMRCNLDFVSHDKQVIGEIKTSKNPKEWGEEDTDDVPIPYLIQCAHNRIVASDFYGVDYQEVHLVVLLQGFGRPEIRRYFYKKNPKLESIIIQKEKQFWNENVLKQIPPEQTVIKEICELETDESIHANDEVIQLIQEQNNISNEMKSLKEKQDCIKQNISKILNNKSYIVDDNGRKIVSYKTQIRNRFDTTEFKKSEPEIYGRFCKQTSHRTMIFKEL